MEPTVQQRIQLPISHEQFEDSLIAYFYIFICQLPVTFGMTYIVSKSSDFWTPTLATKLK